MNFCDIVFAGERLKLLASGALYWPEEKLFCVSDLHLGKSDRIARRTGIMLPPYETADTLARTDADLDRTGAKTVICLGDSFDDREAADALTEEEKTWILRMQAGRRWIWIEGNHDPGPLSLGGSHVAEITRRDITFRHIARDGAVGEVSGHYHPKAKIGARGRSISRPCFLFDTSRIIMPAYGTYTGGLDWRTPAIRALFGPEASAAMLGEPMHVCPVPPVQDATARGQAFPAPGKSADMT